MSGKPLKFTVTYPPDAAMVSRSDEPTSRTDDDLERRVAVLETIVLRSDATHMLQPLCRWVMVFPFVWRYRKAVADPGSVSLNYMIYRFEYGPPVLSLSRPRNTPDKNT